MQRLPLSVQNAYSDLLDRLQDDVVLKIGGKPGAAQHPDEPLDGRRETMPIEPWPSWRPTPEDQDALVGEDPGDHDVLGSHFGEDQAQVGPGARAVVVLVITMPSGERI